MATLLWNELSEAVDLQQYLTINVRENVTAALCNDCKSLFQWTTDHREEIVAAGRMCPFEGAFQSADGLRLALRFNKSHMGANVMKLRDQAAMGDVDFRVGLGIEFLSCIAYLFEKTTLDITCLGLENFAATLDRVATGAFVPHFITDDRGRGEVEHVGQLLHHIVCPNRNHENDLVGCVPHDGAKAAIHHLLHFNTERRDPAQYCAAIAQATEALGAIVDIADRREPTQRYVRVRLVNRTRAVELDSTAVNRYLDRAKRITMEDKAVTCITEGFCVNMTELQETTITSTALSTIQLRFHCGATKLQRLSLAAPGLAHVGAEFLQGCTVLTNVQLPITSLKTIGNKFCESCSSLTNLQFSGVTCMAVTAFPDDMLTGCRSLERLDLSAFTHVTSIGHRFLAGSERLISLTLPTAIESIGDSFLLNALSLETLDTATCFSNLRRVGANFCKGCSSLKFKLKPMKSFRESAAGLLEGVRSVDCREWIATLAQILPAAGETYDVQNLVQLILNVSLHAPVVNAPPNPDCFIESFFSAINWITERAVPDQLPSFVSAVAAVEKITEMKRQWWPDVALSATVLSEIASCFASWSTLLSAEERLSNMVSPVMKVVVRVARWSSVATSRSLMASWTTLCNIRAATAEDIAEGWDAFAPLVGTADCISPERAINILCSKITDATAQAARDKAARFVHRHLRQCFTDSVVDSLPSVTEEHLFRAVQRMCNSSNTDTITTAARIMRLSAAVKSWMQAPAHPKTLLEIALALTASASNGNATSSCAVQVVQALDCLTHSSDFCVAFAESMHGVQKERQFMETVAKIDDEETLKSLLRLINKLLKADRTLWEVNGMLDRFVEAGGVLDRLRRRAPPNCRLWISLLASIDDRLRQSANRCSMM